MLEKQWKDLKYKMAAFQFFTRRDTQVCSYDLDKLWCTSARDWRLH